MNIKYFVDTDTAMLNFSEKKIQETKGISENVFIDIDFEGNLVSMTIEHAKATGTLTSFSYEEMRNKIA